MNSLSKTILIAAAGLGVAACGDKPLSDELCNAAVPGSKVVKNACLHESYEDLEDLTKNCAGQVTQVIALGPKHLGTPKVTAWGCQYAGSNVITLQKPNCSSN